MPLIPISQLRFDRNNWPRDAVDEGRVEMFFLQMQEDEAFPPIEVVPRPDGSFLVGDGIHRTLAVQRLERSEIEAVIATPRTDETPSACAYRIALETATRSALPLTRAERRRAAVHLLETCPDFSRRQIAQLVGVAHSSVNRWAEEVADSSTRSEDADRQMPIGPSPDRVAAQLVSTLDRLSGSRGILDYLAPKRMGRHLAEAFVDRFGDSALDEAQRFRAWLDVAVTALRDAEG
ncbi:MAG: ParB N-terminal domain-containing protein [Acidimicrobiales bacterium]